MKRLFCFILSSIAGLWLADQLVPSIVIKITPESNFFGIKLTAYWQILAISGTALGLIIFLFKPILNIITLPLRILTLGIFNIFINMGLIWIIDVIFDEIYIPWFLPLFFAALIIGVSNLLFLFFLGEY